MTKREFFAAITTNESLSAEIREFAQAQITQLDNALQRRKLSPSAQKANEERDAFRAQVYAVLTEEPQTAAEIANILGVSTNKVSNTLWRIEGVQCVDFKPEGAKRKMKGYYRT